MSDKKLEVLESRVLEAAKDCPTVKAALAKIFPETFKPKEEWEDVTKGVVIVPIGALGDLFICFDDLGYGQYPFKVVMNGESIYCGRFKIENGRIWRKKA